MSSVPAEVLLRPRPLALVGCLRLAHDYTHLANGGVHVV